MAEIIEVRTTVVGHDKAVELTRSLLLSGLAASVDISQATPAGEDVTWQLAIATTEDLLPALYEHLGESTP
ncbi:hypothetical protein ABZ297_38775 [Nonomuraea sp. NPDC005983]|uniref:hypothetical protein n=1 Tax=Nonomuraea sp. NPDC005983 TaxID=3155595 RepID=UPI0033A96F94